MEVIVNAPDFYPGDNEVFPTSCIKGIFVPVDDYIDYDDPLWTDEKEYAYNYFSLKGRPYIIVYDNTFGNVCAYNRRVMEEFGFDDPAELFYNDEWTWDVFYDMCVEFTDADEDRYALDGYWYSPGIMHSCGESLVVYDVETQQYIDNSDSAAIERAATLLYNLSKNGCIYPRWNNTNWYTRNNGTSGAGIKEGLCLFYIGGTWMFTGTVTEISAVWGDMSEGELMFVPVPRDDNVIVVYDSGYGDKLSSLVATYEGIADSSDASTWAQIKESYAEQMEYYVNQLNTQVAEYDPYSLDEDYEG